VSEPLFKKNENEIKRERRREKNKMRKGRKDERNEKM
jgi:hypothetical protein